MQWCDRNGDQKDCAKGAHTATPAAAPYQESPELSPVTKSLGYFFVNYNFVVPVDSAASVSKFWFRVDENDGKGFKKYDNGGDGYFIDQDQLLFVPTLSNSELIQNQTAANALLSDSTLQRRGGGNGTEGLVKKYNFVVAVRDGSTPPSRVYMHAYDFAIPGFAAPFNETIDLKPSTTISAQSGYSFYAGSVQSNGLQLNLDLFSVAGDGTTYSQDFVPTTFLDTTPYVAPVSNVTVTEGGGNSGSMKLSAESSMWTTGFVVGIAALWTLLL
jgi:hypothetical protein